MPAEPGPAAGPALAPLREAPGHGPASGWRSSGHTGPTDQLQTKIEENVEELRRSLAPYAQDVQGKLNHQLEALAFQMKKHAEELKAKISAKAEELRQGLVPVVNSVRGSQPNAPRACRSPGRAEQPPGPASGGLPPHRGAPLAETFNKAMVQQLERAQATGPPGGAGIGRSPEFPGEGSEGQGQQLLQHPQGRKPGPRPPRRRRYPVPLGVGLP